MLCFPHHMLARSVVSESFRELWRPDRCEAIGTEYLCQYYFTHAHCPWALGTSHRTSPTRSERLPISGPPTSVPDRRTAEYNRPAVYDVKYFVSHP